MTDPQDEEIAIHNEASLRTLIRAISLSQDDFSLILARCNYRRLRERIVQQLHEQCPVEIRELVLDPSAETLYTTIVRTLGQEEPKALIVLGLESVRALDQVLTSANQVREEFRNFSFPLVLWVTDDVLRKLIRLAPDFYSWATSVEFKITTSELINSLQQATNAVFAKVLEVGAGRFAASNPESSSPLLSELRLALQDLQRRCVNLAPELKAGLEFVMGRETDNSREDSRRYYEQSLELWQNSSNLERRGCVLYSLGLWWRSYAVRHRADHQQGNEKAKHYFQQCVEVFEQAQRLDLVAKFINALGGVVQQLKQWDDLEIVANKALELHKTYSKPFRQARAYGFLAEVALARSKPKKAQEFANQALSLIASECSVDLSTVSPERRADLEWIRSYHQGWYLFALARAQRGLARNQESIKTLETARKQTKSHYDPDLCIQILKELRDSYFEQGQYLDAFKVKQERQSIEQQYCFRAFIGIAQLQPQQQVTNPALTPIRLQETVTQEIVASGRQQDVDCLVKRISRDDCKLTIIHGQSGVGKSSILHAGLIPTLKQQLIGTREVLPVLHRVYTDWTKELGRCLGEALGETQNSTPVSARLDSSKAVLEQLRTNANNNLLTVLIFDRFEEFFFVCKELPQRQPFYDFLHECLDNILDVKVILVLREDYLANLLECNRLEILEVTNHNILDKQILYYLGNFSTEEAKSVIESINNRSQFPFESPLIGRLVNDLADGLGEVRPIELQVVGAQLETERISTLEAYQKHGSKEKLVEPKEKLVEEFLEEVIKDCGPENERTALLILYLLTDEANTRPLKSRNELAQDLVIEPKNIEPKNLDLVLEILVSSDLVFQGPKPTSKRYQLAHDYFVPFIRQSQGAELLEELKANRRELNDALRLQQNVAKRQRNLAIAGGSVMALLAILAGVLGLQARKAEIQALNSRSTTLFLTNDHLMALVSGVKAAKKLRSIESIPFLEKIESIPFPGKKEELRIEKLTSDVKDNLMQAIKEIQEINRLKKHSGWVYYVSFSPDGQTIATAGADKTVILWKRDGTYLKTLRRHNGTVNSVSFSPDGQTIATAGADNTVILWKRDGTYLKTLREHTDLVSSVTFSPDGQTIATASWDYKVRLWKRDGTLLKTLSEHTDRVNGVSFSPDGRTIASASSDKTIKLWGLNGTLHTTLQGHDDQVFGVSFSPDGSTIATASWETVKLWSHKHSPQLILGGHADEIYNISFSPDGQMIAGASKDKTLKLWKPDGTLFNTLDDPNDKDDKDSHNDRVWDVSFSPDKDPNRQIIATASWDKTVKLWKRDGSLIKTLDDPKNKDDKDSHNDWVFSVSFSPDGQTIATASSDKTVKLWRRDGTWLRTLACQTWEECKGDNYIDVSFSPDGKTIAAANDVETARLWKLDGTYLQALGNTDESRHTDEVNSVSFSPDGKTIATASDDRTVKLWKRSDTDFKYSYSDTLKGHNERVISTRFSPDGHTIATASFDKTVKLWKQDGTLLHTLQGHDDWVWDVGFAPNGKTLASVSSDKTVRLWQLDIETWQSLQSLSLDRLLERGCNRLRDYLRTNPNAKSDRRICNGMGT